MWNCSSVNDKKKQISTEGYCDDLKIPTSTAISKQPWYTKFGDIGEIFKLEDNSA